MKYMLKFCSTKKNIKRSAIVSLIIGTILTLINQIDFILNFNITPKLIIQIFLTYLIPFLVSMYGGASYYREINNKIK